MATSQSQSSLPPIDGHHSFSNQPLPPHVSDTGFPILAFAILGITATAFLLVSYYVFVTKCCFRWHLADPLGRFSIRRAQPNDDGPLTFYSPSSWQSRGLDELLIREIPTFQYGKPEKGGFTGPTKCVVCLNEFQDREILRVLPKCSHAFHLDCIDVWLLGNSNCPLCRSAISGRNRYRPRPEWIVAPTTSPQDPLGDDEFVEIVISGRDESETGAAREDSRRFSAQSRSHSSRKFEHKVLKSNKTRKFSIMGDEEIDIGAKDDDDQFRVQPIRRSFSMDSAADRHVYLSVQETVRRNRSSEEEEESGSRSRRSIFSFGHGRGSRNALHPVE